jgi:Flp pilus assembly protein TadB
MTGLAGTPIDRHPEGMARRNGSGWAWVVVGLLALVVLVETVVLAVMASLLSIVIAVVVPVAVLLVAVLIVRDVRRHWEHPAEESASWEQLSA